MPPPGGRRSSVTPTRSSAGTDGRHAQPARTGRTLDKAQIAALPLGWFPGTIHVADSEQAVADALASLAGVSILGFDTETRPAFTRGERHPIAVLQLAAADHAVLVQLQWAGMPAPLREILESEAIIKAAQAPAEELRALTKRYRVHPRGIVDVGRIAREAGFTPSSVRGQAAHFLGMRISKGPQVSNWAQRRLSPAQQRYAATDAWVCRQSYLALQRDANAAEGSPR